MAAISATRKMPFRVELTKLEEQQAAVNILRRPTKQYASILAAAPKNPNFGEDSSMTGYLLDDQYFGNIHNCNHMQQLPNGPVYLSTHLRTIAKHFTDPLCHITTDAILLRDVSDLASLSANYPWIFSLEVYTSSSSQPQTWLNPSHRTESQLLSTRTFFRDTYGPVGSRPYVEITKQESLEFVKSAFEEEKPRTGLWICKAENPWGHFEHWGRQYVVRFLKKKPQPNQGQSSNFA